MGKDNENVLNGFTDNLEKELAKKASTEEITEDNVLGMPTYAFAVLALQNDDPNRVIRVIEAMKKRYAKKKNFDSSAMGFLLDIEGKAYAYMALDSKLYGHHEKYIKIARKCFKAASNSGYYDALGDLAEFEKRITYIYDGVVVAEKMAKNTFEGYSRLGALHFGFADLVENAYLAMNNKELKKDNERLLSMAHSYYMKGAFGSTTCLLCAGLCSIIEGEVDRGLRVVKSLKDKFIKDYKDYRKILFSSDAKKCDEAIKTLEKICKNNIR